MTYPRIAWTTLLPIAMAFAAPAAAQDVPEDALRHFEQGEALLERGNYEGALAEYESAYGLMEGHPRRYFLLFNIGQAYERTFRYDRALEYYRRYLDEGGPEADDRAAVEARIEALEGLLGTLNIEVNVPSAEVWVDGHRVGTAPGSFRVPGGPHVVELRAESFEPDRREVQVSARSEQELRFELDERFYGVHPAFFWSTLGGAAVVAGIGAVFGVQALNARADIDDRLADPRQRHGVVRSELDEVSTLALTADVFFAAAGVLAVGAGVLFFVTDFGGGSEDEGGEAVTVSPSVGPTGAGIRIRGAL